MAQLRVFDGETQIGTYERNFPLFAEETFESFEWKGSWFALYSPDYTSTRVMSLPDCRDIGGESPSAEGFCPVDFLVPRYREATYHYPTGEVLTGCEFQEEDDPSPETTFGPWVTVPTGFIAGCIWGDDRSWKLQCIDIALAAQGRIERSERFGFVEMPSATLSTSLEFYRSPSRGEVRVTLIREERRDVATGALIDPYKE